MKFAIIADIHSNLDAFQVVLEDIKQQKCTHYACLGDVVGYNANPKECLDIVRRMNMPCVKGNHDEYCSTDGPLDGFNPAAAELLLDLIKPIPGDLVLDAGCGTGVFTLDLLHLGCHIIGIDLSMPMLARAKQKAGGHPFRIVLADLLNLPFSTNSFDKVISVTALEFIEDGRGAIDELFRVTKRGGRLVVATLNSLSPWAEQRKAEARQKHTIFEHAIFRCPEELLSLTPIHGEARTAIHFRKEENPELAPGIEQEGAEKRLNTGAFLAARWVKP